ncbi:MAG TPA: glycosyltransferase family 9 protein [Planctomycetota bacterium]|nr:glycosyltransferase family 9 protein [Planctomycetota bacterium]
MRLSHDGLRVRDFSSSEWLGLFSESPLGESAHAALAAIQTAVVFLPDSSTVAVALRRSGVANVIEATPPVASTNTNGRHASEFILQQIASSCGADACQKARELLSIEHDPLLAIEDDERVRALDRIGFDLVPDAGMVAIHPGSGGRKKCWSVKSFAKLAVELSCSRGLLPLVFFGPADDEVRDAFEAAIPAGVEWQPVVGRPLREVLALLTQCRAYVGNDSGVTHLAARACPTVAIFGPTDPSIWRPLGRSVQIVRAADGNLDKVSVDDVQQALSQFGIF